MSACQIILLFGVGLAAFQIHETQAVCDALSVGQCSLPIDVYQNPPRDSAQFDALCQQRTTVRTCLNDLGCTSSSNPDAYRSYLLGLGLVDGIEYGCTDASVKQIYLNNLPCTTTVVASQGICRSSGPPASCAAGIVACACEFAYIKLGCNEAIATVTTTFNYHLYRQYLTVILHCDMIGLATCLSGSSISTMSYIGSGRSTSTMFTLSYVRSASRVLSVSVTTSMLTTVVSKMMIARL